MKNDVKSCFEKFSSKNLLFILLNILYIIQKSFIWLIRTYWNAKMSAKIKFTIFLSKIFDSFEKIHLKKKLIQGHAESKIQR